MRDRWLMISLLTLFAMAAVLHVKEIGRTGLGLPPVFAVLELGGDGVPVVGGLRLERSASWNDLQPGDRLLRVGDTDLRGVPYAVFDAIVLDEAGTGGSTALVFEREGVESTIDLEVRPYAHPWSRLPLMLGLVLVATVVLLRSPGTRQGRLFFAGVTLIASAELPFYGGPPAQSIAYVALFNVGMPIGIWLWLRWLVGFPDGVPEERRPSRHVAWLALVFPLARLPYHLGGPIPTESIPGLVLASDALLAAASVAIVSRNYLYADLIGRRQVKWIVIGGYAASLPLLIVAGSAWLAPDAAARIDFHRAFPLVMIAPLLVIAGMLVGIVRYNLFDIDRIMSVTATYSVSIGLVLGVLVGLVPFLARWIADALALDESTLRFVITIVLALAIIPLYRRLRDPVNELIFPKRHSLERGITQLLQDISDCQAQDDVVALVSSRLQGLLDPIYVSVLSVNPHLTKTISGPRVSGVGPGSRFLRWVESHPWPGRIERGRFDGLQVEAPHDSLARTLADPVVVLPIRDGKDLFRVILVGPLRSGDVLVGRDLTLLGAVAEQAAAQLKTLRDNQAIEMERIRSEELRSLKEAAEQAHESRSRFLAAASHDLRQPLHALGLYIEALADAHAAGDLDNELIDRIRGSASSLEEMFDALLDVSRLDVGSVEARPVAFRVDGLLAQIAEQVEPDARRKQIEIEVEGCGASVVSDPVLLGRIVRNLAVNAVRYTEEGSVAIRSRVEGAHVVVEVQDTGPGIPRSRQSEIFDEFVQLAPNSQQGLGLGLSIVARLGRLLAHPIDVESEPGKGATFRVTLPLALEEALEDAPIGAAGIDLENQRILVVDDDLRILEATGSMLRRWGCQVMLAAGLDDVEESLGVSPPPDVVLADLRLRGTETGVDAIELVRRVTGTEVPAALVTGESGAALPTGYRVLRKPVRPMRLRALLVELIGGERD